MADQDISRVIDAVPWVPDSVSENSVNGSTTPGVESAILRWIVPSGTIAPKWWSESRDSWLRTTWKNIDPIKVAVNTFTNKAVTIPIRISAKDRNVRRHVIQASDQTNVLQNFSGLMRGWKEEFKKFIQDYLTQDNGAFFLIQAYGPVNTPIVGSPLGVQHLDAKYCRRTSDPRFPVIYTHVDGKRYKLHYTRVIYFSNLPSAERDMNGVGLSAFTCALDSGIEIRDVYTYMQEKFGSRPKRQILYVKTGATLTNLVDAINFGDSKMDSESLDRFSKTVLMAPTNPNNELDIGLVDLASTPDNFNRMDIQLIDMSMVAASFGLDLSDLAISFGVGISTRSNAEVQERKGRGKGVGEMLETLQIQINEKYLPDHLTCMFDNQDDAQDEEQSKIWDMRSTARQRDLTTGSTTIQVERARMLRNNEITEEEYASMELLDGRLPNGASVMALYYYKEPIYRKYLSHDGDITNPDKNDVESILDWCDQQEKTAYQDLEVAPTANITQKIFECIAAIVHLRALYEGYREEQEQLAYAEEMQTEEAGDMQSIEEEAIGEQI